jgi:hypothetical protein
VLDTRHLGWAAAEAACGGYGGHLASFAAAQQQARAEAALLRAGALLPPHHRWVRRRGARRGGAACLCCPLPPAPAWLISCSKRLPTNPRRRAYWIGLSTAQWPDFAWVDPSVAPPPASAATATARSGYHHWGNYTAAPGTARPASPEPDNRGGSQVAPPPRLAGLQHTRCIPALPFAGPAQLLPSWCRAAAARQPEHPWWPAR